ncbi:MAG: hypothetical protein MUF85_02150 [Patescibacteria group bacterium]|nr:hypothetical protein [Patescibacteria group bacterium]
MSADYWQKQLQGKPLYPEIIWNKPENQAQAGKLLIIGGNSNAITTPSQTYQLALNQKVGQVKVVMPLSTKKYFGGQAPADILFAQSNPSGSFSQKAFDDIKLHISWADGTLLAGDFGHNSETAILLENIIKLPGLLVFNGDTIDYFSQHPTDILNRSNTILVGDFADIQKIIKNSGFYTPITSTMPLANLVECLHLFTNQYKPMLVTVYLDFIVLAMAGQVISTKLNNLPANWQNTVATNIATWVLQQPQNPLKTASAAISQTILQ